MTPPLPLQVECKHCGLTADWVFFTFFEREMYWGCRKCGYRAKSPIPHIFAPRRILYLDQFALSNLLRGTSPEWERLREQLLLLSSRQFWLVPLFQNHFDETARLPEAASREHFELMQRLAHGRMLREPQEIKETQILNAFRAFRRKENSWGTDYMEAFYILDPRYVMPPFSVFFQEDLSSLRPPGAEFYLKWAQDGFAQLRKEWAGDPLPLQESRQIEHNFQVEIHLDMLSLMTLGVVSKTSYLMKPRMFPIYLNSIGRNVSLLLQEIDGDRDKWPLIEEFFKSKHFGTVPFIAIDNVLFAYLREQAQSHAGKLVNPEKQARKHRGDIGDTSFISLMLPYVSDIFVDARFEELLRKPKMRQHVGKTRVWTARTISDLSQQAEEELSSRDFVIVDGVFRQLAPIEENEFVPRDPGQRLVYGGVVV